MEYDVTGHIAQSVRLSLVPGRPVWVSNGALMAYSAGVRWQLKVPGGVSGAVRRSLSGEGLSLTHLTATADGDHAILSANAPGTVRTWDLATGPVVTTRGAFLAAWGDHVDIDVTVARRAGAALFGGAGLFLQRISGRGTVLIHGSGDFRERTLADGEQLLVSTGNLAAFGGGVDYDVQGVGGCRKMFFGGEGLFMTRLTGPGPVYLQTLKRHAGSSSAQSG